MIALGTYADDMRWVALQQEVPLFDRFSIMKLWADLGTFDFTRRRINLTWPSAFMIALDGCWPISSSRRPSRKSRRLTAGGR